MMNLTSRHQLPLASAALLVLALSSSVASAEQTITTQGFKDSTSQAEELANAFNRADGLGNTQVRANSPLLAVPLSLARFMFPKSLGRGRTGGDQTALMLAGVSNKRSAQGSVSSGGLDTLIGASGLGKRSVPLEYNNAEVAYGSRGLDPLITGSGLGKRSVPSDYISVEPFFSARPVAVLRNAGQQARARHAMPSQAWDQTTMEMLEAGANEI